MSTYWESKGLYQAEADALEKLLPIFGEVPDNKVTNKYLEKFRKAQNCYYDLYNNGLCNKAREFSTVFRIPGVPREIKQNYGRYDMISKATADAIEARMDEIILAAAKEQGIA
jgi:hypothetical protein